MAGEGFLSRWSKRKVELANKAEPTAEPPVVAATAVDPSRTAAVALPDADQHLAADRASAQDTVQLPSIESLTGESDYAPFMARDVAPAMRNQAMKKLFTDPRYNVMDGLDIYIDDYGKPDPLPEGWLQLLNQSKSLRLFETKQEEVERLTGAAGTPPAPEVEPTADDAVASIEADAAVAAVAPDNLVCDVDRQESPLDTGDLQNPPTEHDRNA